MKKNILIIILVLVVLVAGIALLRLGNGGEDNWIKDSRGVWIKHGNPSGTPDYVLAQQTAIEEAIGLYDNMKTEGMTFSSQCLGTAEDYAIDIVHVPRNAEDNLEENQCSEFREGYVSKFIELDKEGNVVKMSD